MLARPHRRRSCSRQILVAIADGIFVGRLGTDALAGMALVIPFVTLMFNIANGGMGGGVASAIARALGAGRSDDARAMPCCTP